MALAFRREFRRRNFQVASLVARWEPGFSFFGEGDSFVFYLVNRFFGLLGKKGDKRTLVCLLGSFSSLGLTNRL